MTDQNFEQMTYDKEAEAAYIYFTEPDKFQFYTEVLPENSHILLDLGKEVPVVGIELAGELAKKLGQLPVEQRCFVKAKDNHGHDYYTLQLEDKPVLHAISYERIVDVKFLFADDEFVDLVGIEVYNCHPEYIFNQSTENGEAKGIFKKLLGKILP